MGEVAIDIEIRFTIKPLNTEKNNHSGNLHPSLILHRKFYRILYCREF